MAIVLMVAGCGAPRLFGLHTTIPARAGDPASPQLDVSVEDSSGLVRSIAPADPVDSPNAVDVVPGSDYAYRVTWLGGECDTHTTLRVGWGGVRLGIVVRSDVNPTAVSCSAIGIRRQVIISLSQFVPSTQFSVQQAP